ncbi:cAMP-dependent protein kinase catalytic subunit PRKX [Smittium culicis]|uniref:cAMP-dependent protein kinase n=1 Tax=Smittium culicis TaxID=133412 RepID=A0A1R1Y4V2_9FUNG|nr:cAMP-dependent protein kinase catalytic subunit PRKX [Smittium culicis]
MVFDQQPPNRLIIPQPEYSESHSDTTQSHFHNLYLNPSISTIHTPANTLLAPSSIPHTNIHHTNSPLSSPSRPTECPENSDIHQSSYTATEYTKIHSPQYSLDNPLNHHNFVCSPIDTSIPAEPYHNRTYFSKNIQLPPITIDNYFPADQASSSKTFNTFIQNSNQTAQVNHSNHLYSQYSSTPFENEYPIPSIDAELVKNKRKLDSQKDPKHKKHNFHNSYTQKDSSNCTNSIYPTLNMNVHKPKFSSDLSSNNIISNIQHSSLASESNLNVPRIIVPHYSAIPTSTPISAPQSLDDFAVIKTLGTGTFGRVYLCKERKSNTFHAIKVLKKAQVVKLKQVEHISNEKNILSFIKHSFIVNLKCSFQDIRNLYMVMEFVPGGELFSHLRRAGRFPTDVARFYASEIVLAIEYLHKHNIIYRDMKPENLLLDREGHIKIADFGFAKYVTDRTWTLCGTPEYLAPEIIRGKGHGKPVDWWAIGILIFEMIAGYPPFYDNNPFGTYGKILAGELSYPSFVSHSTRDIISCLLTVDVGRRLGNLSGGSNDVKMHPWFFKICWFDIINRLIIPPIIPNYEFPGDSSNFDTYPEPPSDSEPEPGIDPYHNLFENF